MSANNGYNAKRKSGNPRSPQVLAASAVGRTSDGLELDDLLRVGIAEAQFASVARTRRERERHLGISRELLITALKRGGAADPDLRAHLLAVLLKLGQDARSVMGIISESGEASSSSASPSNEEGRQKRPTEIETSGEHSDSDHSSKAAELDDVCFDYAPMPEGDSREGLLGITPESDSFHQDSFGTISPSGSHQSLALTEPGSPNSTDIGKFKTPQKLPATVSSETWSSLRGLESAAALAAAHHSALAGQREANEASASKHSAGGSQSWAMQPSPLDHPSIAPSKSMSRENSEHSLSMASRRSHSKEATTGPQGLSEPIISLKGLEAKIGGPGRGRSGASGGQPQQAGNLGVKSRRQGKEQPPVERQGRSNSIASDSNSSNQSSIVEKRVRRQPSQPSQSQASSSSGSQGTTSDDEKKPKKWQSQRSRGAADPIVEEPSEQWKTIYVGEKTSSGNNFSSSSTMPHGLKRTTSANSTEAMAQNHLSKNADSPANMTNNGNGQGGYSPQSNTPTPSNSMPKWSPTTSHRKTSSGNWDKGVSTTPQTPQTAVATPQTTSRNPFGVDGPITRGVSGSFTPAVTPALTPAATPLNTDTATPTVDPNMRNPLSQLDGLSSQKPFAGGSNPFAVALHGNGGGSNPSFPPSVGSNESNHSNEAQDNVSIAGSLGGLSGITPYGGVSAPTSPITRAANPGGEKGILSVRILNGVSGEEEARFPISVEAASSEHNFIEMLDRLCQQKVGHNLSRLHWLKQGRAGDRFQRRTCDINMVEDVIRDFDCQPVLLLCTIPAPPPSEMPVAAKVRIRGMQPTRVSCGQPQVTVKLDTSLLAPGHHYSVAFTHQWSNTTYSADATLLPDHRGVELFLPQHMLQTSSSANVEGLYDVHLVIDHSSRSENRRALTVGSAESDVTSSSTAVSSKFVPIKRQAN